MTRLDPARHYRTMDTLPTCPVCGHDVEPDGTHAEVSVNMEVAEQPEDDEYVLHRRCASAVFGGWE
jgi:hypothetical protein